MRIAALALVACLSASSAVAAPHDARLARVRTFALSLGDGAANKDLSGYDLVVVDGDTPAKRVRALRDGGAVVLGYVAAGDVAAADSATAAACAAGALSFVSDIDLTRIPQPPPRC